jgi:protease-4
VDIDSPGGAIDPSDIIYQRLRRFREDTGKPVVANMNGVAASGGYYIAAAADRIIAHPSCITGSIGVIIQSLNVAGLFEKVGVDLVTLTSGPNKDLLNPGREMNEEERRILMGVVDDAYESFVQAVATGRGLELDAVRAAGDGRIYTARQALALDLIDRVGYREELLEELRAAAGVERVEVVEHKLPAKIWDILELGFESLARRASPTARLEDSLDDWLPLEPGLYYLWRPGL